MGTHSDHRVFVHDISIYASHNDTLYVSPARDAEAR